MDAGEVSISATAACLLDGLGAVLFPVTSEARDLGRDVAGFVLRRDFRASARKLVLLR